MELKRSFAAGVVLLGVLQLEPALPAPVHSPAHAGAAAAVVPYSGVCDTSDALDLLGDLKDDGRKHDQIAVLQGRIADCAHRIAATLAHLPAPTPTPYWLPATAQAAPAPTPAPVCFTPPPAATMASNRFALYETLTQCFTYWSYLKELPTPAPAESTLPRLASRPSFYVYATGAADSAAAAVLIRSIVGRLTKAQQLAGAAPDIAIVPRGDWIENAEFAAQCQADPNTRGALVIETSIPETSRRNYFLLVADITNVSASVEMLGCSEEDHNPAASPLSIWSANGLTGKAHETALTTGILTALAALLVTTKSTTTLTTGNGRISYSSTQRTASAASGNVVSYLQDQNLNLPAQNASTGLLVASERFADSTMEQLQLFCAAPQVRRVAAEAKPPGAAAPPEHRTLPYKAAALYVEDCARFADFGGARQAH